MKKLQVKNVLTDIRFWLVIFFAIRLFGITNPPLETGHNWRQALTNMIARNFLENGADLLRPRIDIAGDRTGILGTEFPLFNYLIYLVSSLFDYSHWYGRLINLIFSTAGLYYFYKLVRNFLDKQAAFNATIILTTSIWFAFSRKIMPDTFSVSLLIISLYYGYCFLKAGGKLKLFLFFILCTLGMLSKIPALSLFSSIAVVVFIREIPLRRKVWLYTAAVIGFSVVCIWYFYWVPYLHETYRFQLFLPKSIMEGVREIIPRMDEFLEKFYFSSLHSYAGFACFIIGVVLLFRSKHFILKLSIGLITLVFLLFAVKTGVVFPTHNYYIVPYSPVVALVAGYAIAHLPARFQYVLLGLIAVEGIINQQHDFFIDESQEYKLRLEQITEEVIPEGNLVVINGGYSPQDMYFAHRKGWTVPNKFLHRPAFLDSLTKAGAEYMIIDKSKFAQELQYYELVYSDDHYNIYKMEETGIKGDEISKPGLYEDI